MPSPLSLLSRQGRERRRQQQEDEADWVRVDDDDVEEVGDEGDEAPTPKAGTSSSSLRRPWPAHSLPLQHPRAPSLSPHQPHHPSFSRRRGGSGLVHELGAGALGVVVEAGGGMLEGLSPPAAAGGGPALEDEEEEASEEESEEEEEELVHGDGSYVFRRKAGTISVSGFEAAIGEGGILSEVCMLWLDVRVVG